MLLNRSNGFGIGPTVNPCTKGLWIWNKPIQGQMSDGTPINVLIVDSEGIGALNEDSSHDTKIFSLAVLLSSCFIYNSVGSIDENAIQNLSLIVNLTKNIHIRSQSGPETEEFEDFSPYLPSFVWVVRDFTLQLVDTEGENIDSKEYLEKALCQQKGFSESVESKNRIRRLLTTFFKDRDCWTLVRPLTKEENLQNLDKFDLGKLRPEFYDQVSKMRQKIMCNIKPKFIEKTVIDGEMYIGLIKSYIEAINNGGIPNIENAWVSVCREQCGKGLQEAFEFYERSLKECIYGRLPLNIEDLAKFHRDIKEKTMGILEKKALGDGLIKEFHGALITRMKKKYALLRAENLKESKRKCFSFLCQEYKKIEQKLNLQEYANFTIYEKDLTVFQENFIKKGPNSVDSEKFLMDFLRKVSNEAAHLFLKVSRNELEIHRTLAEDFQKKMDEKIAETQRENNKERENLLEKLSEIERFQAAKTVIEGNLEKDLSEIKSKYELKDQELKQVSKKLQEETDKARYENRLNSMGFDEMVRNIERENILKIGECEKENALLMQRVQFLEKSNEELMKKDKDQANESRNSRKELTSQMKELTAKYDQNMKINMNKINELQDKIIELETDLHESQINIENEQKKRILAESFSMQTIEEFKEKLFYTQQELNKIKEEKDMGFERSRNHDEKITQNLNDKINELQRLLSQKEEKSKANKSENDKEKAILMQKLEFQNLHLKETEQQLCENKKAHEAILKALEFNTADDFRVDSKQLEHLKDVHKREIKALENEFENQKKRLILQIEQLNEKSHELELKAKLEGSDLRNELQSVKEEFEQSEVSRAKLLEQIRQTDLSKVKLLKEAEERYFF